MTPDGLLAVTGSDAASTLRITTDLASGRLVVIDNGTPLAATFDPGGLSGIRLAGGAGADTLVVSADVALPVTLSGGGGDDTLVALSTAPVTFAGGDGTDAFWAAAKTPVTLANADRVESRRGVNRLPPAFSKTPVRAAPLAAPSPGTAGLVSTERSGGSLVVGSSPALPDPRVTAAARTYRDFSDRPLFSAEGPSDADVSQGALNDCFALAALAGVASTDPSVIRRTVTDLGDGSYAVRLVKGRSVRYYHVDAELPVSFAGSTDPAYAGLGVGGSIWVAVVEKALALDAGGSYARLDKGGWMATTFAQLGVSSSTTIGAATGLSAILRDLRAGKAVTLGTRARLSPDSPLNRAHAYSVDSVQLDERGRPVSFTLRNPIAWDGQAGLVTVSAKALAAALTAVVSGAPRA